MDVNVFLIVIDTLRRDVMSLYGGDTDTPFINEIARDGVLFENAVSSGNWTPTSHMSIFSGLYPGEHGVHENYDEGDEVIFKKMLEYDGHWFVKDLYKRGYSNIGYSTNPWLSPSSMFDLYYSSFTFFSSEYLTEREMEAVRDYKKYGKNRIDATEYLLLHGKFKEFSHYYHTFRWMLKKKREYGYPFYKASDIIIDNILNSSFNEPFFTFINFMEVHEPSSSWELDTDDRKIKYNDLFGFDVIGDRKIKDVREGYRKSLKNVDYEIGRLVNFLKKKKMYDSSLIIITSDHGQAMKEQRKIPFYGHGNFLYDEIIEIPLIVKYPGNVKIKRKSGYQSLVNIKKLIENAVDGNNEDVLTEETVFSEMFGPVHNLKRLSDEGIIKKMDNIYEKIIEYFPKRKAVYSKGFKLVINGENGEVEEFTFHGKKANVSEHPNVLKNLRDEISIFRGNEKFVV
ncbi:MAG: sulfatase [Thermoplasmata archaeon]